eukprot:6665422-Prymnesium_polylepis.1
MGGAADGGVSQGEGCSSEHDSPAALQSRSMRCARAEAHALNPFRTQSSGSRTERNRWSTPRGTDAQRAGRTRVWTRQCGVGGSSHGGRRTRRGDRLHERREGLRRATARAGTKLTQAAQAAWVSAANGMHRKGPSARKRDAVGRSSCDRRRRSVLRVRARGRVRVPLAAPTTGRGAQAWL